MHCLQPTDAQKDTSRDCDSTEENSNDNNGNNNKHLLEVFQLNGSRMMPNRSTRQTGFQYRRSNS